MMKPKFFIDLLLIFLLIVGNRSASYAQLWPGDINNNGIVNHVDLIYFGEALFQTGPPREISEQGIFWEEKTIEASWGASFSGTATDLSFADCDGNGIVDFLDADAIHFNFGLTHGTVTPDVFPVGTPGLSPELFFDMSLIPEPLLEAGILIVPLVLGTEANPVDNFTSIGFTINYDTDILLAESIDFFFENSWIDPGGNSLIEVINNDEEQGVLTVSASRLVNAPISGSGPIGIMTIIIEDDVVGLSEPAIETLVEIDQILVTSPGLVTQPVVGDTLVLEILPDDIILNEESPEDAYDLNIFPNPVRNTINLKLDGDVPMEGIQLFNTIGQEVVASTFSPTKELRYDVQNIPRGIYFLQVQLANGTMVSRKIVLEH